MPKASILLRDGTKIEIHGTVEEVQRLTEHYSRVAAPRTEGSAPKNGHEPAPTAVDGGEPDVAAIVAIIRDCDEAERIETRVLDQKDVLNRVLLCLWIVHKYVDQMLGLTSGDVERITEQLGVKVGISNASNVLSGRAKSFVAGDTVRKRGGTVRYRLNRRGVQHFDAVLATS